METPIREQQAISLRKYFYEYVVLGLVASVVFLMFYVSDLNKFIRTELQKQIIDNNRVIERNTDAVNTFILHQH